MVQDWEALEEVWKHTFELLGVSPRDHPVLLSESPLTPDRNRAKMAEVKEGEGKRGGRKKTCSERLKNG